MLHPIRFLYRSMFAKGARDTRQNEGVARVQMGEMTDLIDKHRTAGTARRRPTLDPWREHEVIQNKLPVPFEEVEQVHFASRTSEDIAFVDFDHRESATLRS
jgi:hypothetical protein